MSGSIEITDPLVKFMVDYRPDRMKDRCHPARLWKGVAEKWTIDLGSTMASGVVSPRRCSPVLSVNASVLIGIE